MKKIALYGKFNQNMLNSLHAQCPASFETYEVESDDIFNLVEADYILCRAVAVNKNTFDVARNVKMVQKWGAGYDKIDIQEASRRQLPVAVCLGGNSIPVAELTVTLMLDVLRNVVSMAGKLKDGLWAREQYATRSYLLHGKTVGLIGIGNIARKVAEIVRGGFQCKVLYYDVFRLSEAQEQKLGVHYVDLDTLMSSSDIVSIHVPLLESTVGMIDRSKLEQMKNTAILINTSRGGVVNEKDLIAVLKEGKILGAGLDTFATEPLDQDSELLKLDCVVTTPHCGGNTVDNDVNMAMICMENIASYDMTGDKTMRAIVNRDALTSCVAEKENAS